MTTAQLERIEDAENAEDAKADEAYRGLVAKLARGEKVADDSAIRILKAAEKTSADLSRDLAEFEVRSKLYAAAAPLQSLTAEAERLKQRKADSEKEREAFLKNWETYHGEIVAESAKNRLAISEAQRSLQVLQEKLTAEADTLPEVQELNEKIAGIEKEVLQLAKSGAATLSDPDEVQERLAIAEISLSTARQKLAHIPRWEPKERTNATAEVNRLEEQVELLRNYVESSRKTSSVKYRYESALQRLKAAREERAAIVDAIILEAQSAFA